MFFPPVEKPEGKGTFEFTIEINEPRVTEINCLMKENSIPGFNVVIITILEG